MFKNLLHGGDYNPDQWLDYPDILEEDIRLMKEAHVNCVTLGVFAWSALEPEEGNYTMDWLEKRINILYENGISTILATPTGALPMWLSANCEEVHLVRADGSRWKQGYRHNFCPSSPKMRAAAKNIDETLSKKFGKHPGVIAWHISNEYGGNGTPDSACYCPLCQENFREWLKQRYGTLEALNHAWWTSFWSHTYTSWEQILPPGPFTEGRLHGLNLDWKRFTSYQMEDFMKAEIQAVRTYSTYPVVTNFIVNFYPYNHNQWAKDLDIVAIDSYPCWHGKEDELSEAMTAAMNYDLMRSMKKQPFLLMESVPSTVNWQESNALKRPGMHRLSSLQAIAGGSNSVQYFQWRKGRGGTEKYHGAVLDHKNGGNTRVFRDVAALGQELEELSSCVVKTCNRPKVALIFDWENWWAFEDSLAISPKKSYLELWKAYYAPFWKLGVDVDLIDMEAELSSYSLVVAPVNYMYRLNYEEKVRDYVAQGGTYVTTWFSGEVNDSDLCFLDHHPLQDVLGISTEEIDAPGEHIKNSADYQGKTYEVVGPRALVHARTATVLGKFKEDFYEDYPAVTKNTYGKGSGYFIASQNEDAFLLELTRNLLKETNTESRFASKLPHGVTVKERMNEEEGEKNSLFFLQNFNQTMVDVAILKAYTDVETGDCYTEHIFLEPYGAVILKEV